MAIWQFDLRAVCRESGEVLPRALVEKAALTLVESFDPPWQMTEGWTVYGPDQGNRIDLLRDEDGSGELHVRIDARTDAESFIVRVCILMRLLGCTMYSADLEQYVNGSVDQIKAALQVSDAWRFALDPKSIFPTADGL